MRSRISYPALIVTLLAAAGSLALPPLAEPGKAQPQASPAREVTTSSGLRYLDLKVGQGEEAVPGKIVEVQYTGQLEDGRKFDTCRRDKGEPFTFRLGAGDVIKGWDQGLVGMKVGGKRKLVIPPELGFGKQGVGSVVPPNAVLFYEFELLAVR
jgi:peptidylprolyl isomerase